MAHGTSMCAVFATAVGGVLAYGSSPSSSFSSKDTSSTLKYKIGDIDIETALTIAVAASTFAIAGAKVH